MGFLVLLCGCEKQDGPTLTLDCGRGVKMDLVRIPTGQFVMGSPQSEDGRDPSEDPQHTVRIARPFYLGRHEVTQAQWKAVIGSNQSQTQGDEATLAADSISWSDCQKFCQFLSQRTGRLVRLPTEAEWEYACRAGTTTPFAFGSTLSADQANINTGPEDGGRRAGARRQTKAVGSYPPNAFGIHDMHGNVWEWCQDVFRESYDGAPADGTPVRALPTEPAEQIAYVYRGGSWKNRAADCRSAIRYASQENLRTESLGFRVVVEAK